MNAAILLSGGTGARLGGDIPKQYITVEGRPIVSYALETLLVFDKTDCLQIVAEEKWRVLIREEAERIMRDAMDRGVMKERKQIAFSDPGRNRQESILHGLTDLLDGGERPWLVLIQDAARPLTSGRLIESLFAVMEKEPAADGVIPVLSMKDTVYLCERTGAVTGLLPRERVYRGQAPELFVYEKYLEACRALSVEQLLAINGSTEPAVLAGMNMVTIPGDEKNYKITTEVDLERFIEEFGR